MKVLDQYGLLLCVGIIGVDLLELLVEINDIEYFVFKGEGCRLVWYICEYLEVGFLVVFGFYGCKGSDICYWGLVIGMSECVFLFFDLVYDLLCGQVWNVVIISEVYGFWFGYCYINVKGIWVVIFKEMVVLF